MEEKSNSLKIIFNDNFRALDYSLIQQISNRLTMQLNHFLRRLYSDKFIMTFVLLKESLLQQLQNSTDENY